MAAALMPAIEPDRLADIQPPPGSAQVGLRRFQKQVNMLAHQHIGMNYHTEALGHLASKSTKC